MDDKPAEAVRSKPGSSLVMANRAVGEGRADAVVSAGNTGAMLAAGLLEIRRLKGVHRPAIAVVLPARYGASVLIDAGANADSRPEHLVQFAHMGSIFAEEILERPNPEVRLLSIGEEPEKGNHLVLEAHALLARERAQLQGEHRGARAAALRRRRRRRRRLHRERRPEAARGDDQGAPRRAPRGDLRDDAREARRAAHPARRAGAAEPARPGHLRRRVPPRAPGSLGDRARKLVPDGDRERDPAGRERGRKRRRGSSFGADGGRFRAPRRPRPNEVRWQRRAKKSSSESRKS